MNDRLIDLHEVKHLTCLGKVSIYAYIKNKQFFPIKLGRKTVFSHNEIQEWIKSQCDQRNIGESNDN